MSIDFILNGKKKDLKEIPIDTNTTIFTGTFDPLHTGHLEVANQVLSFDIGEYSSDIVLFFPHVFSTKKKSSALYSRIKLASYLLEYNENLGILIIDEENQRSMEIGDKHWSKSLFNILNDYHKLSYSRVIGCERMHKIANDNEMVHYICPRKEESKRNAISNNAIMLKGTYNTHNVSSTAIRNGLTIEPITSTKTLSISTSMYPNARFN